MGDKTKIDWTDATLNFAYGCTKVSPACQNCYAVGMVRRLSLMGHTDLTPALHYDPSFLTPTGPPAWTGQVILKPERMDQALRWKKPRRIFVNSLSDTFHEGVPDEVLDRLWATMAVCPQHTFQILTKRPERMLAYLSGAWKDRIEGMVVGGLRIGFAAAVSHLSNVWLGVTVEDQATADARIPLLTATPAAVRFISMEPLVGPVDLTKNHTPIRDGRPCWPTSESYLFGMDWVIVGGESGPNARPMHPQWVRDLRDQCQAAGVPFFFKQWGEWAPNCLCGGPRACKETSRPDGAPRGVMFRCGKTKAGHLLDGVEHHAWPKGVRS